tara:strand:- start:107 stop:736 length:630 start_codon:yes stop_codon:yes gene_type:complete
MKPIYFPNVGYIEQKLSKEVMNRLKTYIKNRTKKSNQELAGNIGSSYDLIDKDNWFFNKVLCPTIIEFDKHFTARQVVPKTLTKNCRFVLNKFWVNFQKRYEFNPLHHHTGCYSFVIWVTIPSSYNKEKELPFVKHSNSKSPNSFEFLYTDALGKVCNHAYRLEPSHEETMLFFASHQNHLVYPHYLSTKNRVSISGNVYLDPEQTLND